VITTVENGQEFRDVAAGHNRQKKRVPVGIVVAAGDPSTLVSGPETEPPQYTIVSPLGKILDELNVKLLIAPPARTRSSSV
jgi:hypothetical protein